MTTTTMATCDEHLPKALTQFVTVADGTLVRVAAKWPSTETLGLSARCYCGDVPSWLLTTPTDVVPKDWVLALLDEAIREIATAGA